MPIITYNILKIFEFMKYIIDEIVPKIIPRRE